MKDAPLLFADLTAALEDLHAVAIEGQRGTLSPDIQEALLASVTAGLRRFNHIVAAIGSGAPVTRSELAVIEVRA